MLKVLKFITPLLVFVVLLVFLYRGLYLTPQRLPSALLNKPLPLFIRSRLQEADLQISHRDLLGKVTLLNVFATWCVACVAEHHTLMDIANHEAIYLVGLNYKDKRSAAKAWLLRYGNPYQAVIFDSAGTLAIDLGVYGTPETFVIDKKGIIRYKYVGPINNDVWQKTLRPILSKLKA